MTNNKIIAITMGDPCGIGPEIILKSFASLPRKYLKCYFIIGDLKLLKTLSVKLPFEQNINEISDFNNLSDSSLNVLNLSNLTESDSVPGKPSENSARAALSYIEKAIELSIKNTVCAMVTAPINKNAIANIICDFTGHTEFIARKTGSKNPVMLMVSRNMKVIPLTTHMPIKDVSNRISRANIVKTCRIADSSLKKYFGIKNPRIAVTGLNPHAGEGIFGSEEAEKIIPAINHLSGFGIKVSGPYPADSIFTKDSLNKFDIVLTMYHDQALIPIKTTSFESVVNVTLGIPLIRTSAGHGVAYDIVSKAKANSESMIRAIKLAGSMAHIY